MDSNVKGKWEDFVTTPHVEIIRDYFETRLRVLDIENKDLAGNPSLDGSIKLNCNTARILEINQFLNKLKSHYNALSKGGI